MLNAVAVVAATACGALAQPNPFKDVITRPEAIAIGLDETWQEDGALQGSDLRDADGARIDYWPIVLAPGVWNIQVQSEDFDAYMRVFLEENGLTRADLMFDDDDNGWESGSAGITVRATKEELLGVGASSYDPESLGAYQLVIRRVHETYPAIPLRTMPGLYDLETLVIETVDFYLEDGPFDLAEAIDAAEAVIEIREEHQGAHEGGWWELIDARHRLTQLRTLDALSGEAFAELQVAEETYWSAMDAAEEEDDATAKALYERAIASYEKHLGADSLLVAYALGDLADTLEFLDDTDGALATRERGVEILEEVLGNRHPQTSSAINGLGALHYRLNNDEAAHANFITALAIDRVTLDPRDPNMGTALTNLASAMDELGMVADARRLYEEKLELYAQFYGADDYRTAIERSALGFHLFLMGEYDESCDQLARALPTYEQTFGTDHPDTLQVIDDLAYSEHALGRFEEAIEHFRRVIAGRVEVEGTADVPQAESQRMLALCLEATGQFKAALELHEQVLAFWLELEGEDHEDTKRSRRDVARLMIKIG